MKISKHLLGLMLLQSLFVSQSCTDHVPGPGDPVEVPGPEEGSIYILAEGNLLYEIDLENPTQAIDVIKIETKFPSENILSIDFRPATGQLYALSNFLTLYTINVNKNRTGNAATAINPINEAPETPFPYIGFGFDFDPTNDRIRVSTGGFPSVRRNPENFTQDENDPNSFGALDRVLGLAYSNNYSGATNTTLFAIDPFEDRLLRYNDRDALQTEVVGGLGSDIDEIGGFDIAARMSYQQEYALASVRRGEKWELDVVDLKSGKLTKFSDLPAGNKIIGLAIPTGVAYAINQDRKLLSFNPADNLQYGAEDLIREKLITGVPSGVKLLGLDLSVTKAPKLYALADNSRIYEIDHVTGAARENCRLTIPLDLANNPTFGIDFDPYDNKLRVVSSTRKNFKVELGTGLVSETDLMTLEGDPIKLDAGAYDNVQLGLTNPGFTYFYGMDSETKSVYKMDPATFAMTRVSQLQIDGNLGTFNGFDIGGVNQDLGYGLFTVGEISQFYAFKLETGDVFDFYSFPFKLSGFTLGRYVPRLRS